jgi:precorrin-8X/cobalt-precorrin-8 methylmutase
MEAHGNLKNEISTRSHSPLGNRKIHDFHKCFDSSERINSFHRAPAPGDPFRKQRKTGESMSECFDAFLMVDLSAKKTPSKGLDSVWFCLLEKPGRITLENPRTRHDAFSAIGLILQSMIKDKKRCLVGFDFAFGYPAGFAKALRLSGIPWLKIWEYLFNRIQDRSNNENNRFEIAAEMNRLISNGPGPFWGCPPGEVCASLTRKRPKMSLREDRITDRKIRGPQSIWKLYGNGSVGSQALMGIPYVYRLRFHSSVSDEVRVWPFETGFRSSSGSLITLAEVYPSWLQDSRSGHAVKDARQVRALCQRFFELDQSGDLQRLFAPVSSPPEMDAVQNEEGWILGLLQ